MSERWGSKAVATYLGIKPSTWRALVAQGRAPKPDGVDEGFGRNYWLKTTIVTWNAERPGHGGRPPKQKD